MIIFNLSNLLRKSFGNIYTRLSNPTTAVLEERLASLEGGRGSTCTASGHSAQMVALLPLMSPGSRIVASNKLYGGSITQLGGTFKKFGWHCTFVDADSIDEVRVAAREPGVKAIFAESLANPGGVVTDIAALSEAAREAKIPLVIDNTLATPYLCRPIEHGADIVVHSTTKFLSGHGNAMGGAVVDSGNFDWFTPENSLSSDGGPIGAKFPSLGEPEPGYHGLTFYETFGDLAYTTYCHAVGLRDLGPVS
jgi:O-acetylhomoserine (thiol)-lyase